MSIFQQSKILQLKKLAITDAEKRTPGLQILPTFCPDALITTWEPGANPTIASYNATT
jgi:hypothetical protein